MFFQPELERALDRHACAHGRRHASSAAGRPRGWSQTDERRELTLRGVSEREPGGSRRPARRGPCGRAGSSAPTARTRSCARRAGIARRDLGFQERWLVVDVEPHDMAALAHLPTACQWCDPRAPDDARAERPAPPALGVHAAARTSRPRTSTTRSACGRCSSRGTGRQDGPLTRSAVYEFRSMLADRMRDGPRAARRRRRPPDAAVPRPGAVLGPARRREPRLEARPRAARRSRPTQLLDTIEPERQPQNECDHPPRDRARQGALPARPAGGRRARRDAARGRTRRRRSSSRR